MSNSPVHCYPVSRINQLGVHASTVGGAFGSADLTQACEDIASAHRQAVEKFAQHFGMDPEQVIVSQGHAAEAVPAIAQNQGVSMIILGARELSRWERLVNSVTAEPVLSDAPCDVLFMKDPDGGRVPEKRQDISAGQPEVDMEQAIINPEQVFDRPLDVARFDALSGDLRDRILQAWELDIEAELTAEDEGLPVQPTRGEILAEITEARRMLGERTSR
jgi:nucleotide-binding universal stress UspA family protein